MYIILGGTGRVGSALARALLQQGAPITIVTRSPEKAEHWQRQGARVALADARDSGALRGVLRGGRRAFLLNPPADPGTDTVSAERETAAAITAALDGSGLEKVVVASTYGAQPGSGAGDLNVLYELEQGAARAVPSTAMRSAYYMSNWAGALEAAQREGVLHSFFPVDFALPMVAPEDLGQVAARLLTEPAEHTGTRYVEGPAHYSARAVAEAFARALGRHVEPVTIPREQWGATFEALGFSPAAARSYAKMTALTLDAGPERPDHPERGSTSLPAYIEQLVRRSH